MSKNQPSGDGGLLIEGQGSHFVPTHEPAVETCGSDPFGGNVPNTIVEALQTWLNASATDRYTIGAIHVLKEALIQHTEEQVREAIVENFYGSDREEIRQALIAAGIAKETKTSLQESSEELVEDTAERLLSEAIIHVPLSESHLRSRIALFLKGK